MAAAQDHARLKRFLFCVGFQNCKEARLKSRKISGINNPFHSQIRCCLEGPPLVSAFLKRSSSFGFVAITERSWYVIGESSLALKFGYLVVGKFPDRMPIREARRAGFE